MGQTAAVGLAATTLAAKAAKLEDDLVEIKPGEQEWEEIEAMVDERSRKYLRHYRMKAMKVAAIWKVTQKQRFKTQAEQVKDLGPPMSLFHGTDAGSCEKIIREGFKLPNFSGMFGRGIYFARCPLKSVNYAADSSYGHQAKTAVRKFFGRHAGPVGDHQVMLLCDVYLGRSKKERCPLNVWFGKYRELSKAEELKPSCADVIFCPCVNCWWKRDGHGYDSVWAPGGLKLCCNVVYVSEFVVYDPVQGVPKYIIEFDSLDVKEGAPLVGEPVAVTGDAPTRASQKASITASHAKTPFTDAVPLEEVEVPSIKNRLYD